MTVSLGQNNPVLAHVIEPAPKPAMMPRPCTTMSPALCLSGTLSLADLPSDGWTHVEVAAGLGPQSTATFSVTLTTPGKQPLHFDGLKFVKPEMKELKWLGFSSPGKERAKCWLDEIAIENKPATR